MGMNMVSKGVQNVLDHLQDIFPDMDVISISGNFCADKKATAVNWIEGRGKSVVCEAIIKEKVVTNVLNTSVSSLLELNMIKNLAGFCWFYSSIWFPIRVRGSILEAPFKFLEL